MGYLRALEILREANILYALRRLRMIHRVAASLDFPLAIKFAGIEFPIYASSMRNISLLLSRGRLFEVDERRHLKAMLEVVDVESFWDVGANIGIYGFTALSLRPSCQIVLVEPDRYNLVLLRKTIQRNCLSTVTLMGKAVSDVIGVIQFLPDIITGSTGSILRLIDGETFAERHYKARVSPIEVESTTLDAMLDEIGPPDFIKIDVEGAELAVLSGGRRTVATARPIIMFESAEENRFEDAYLQGLNHFLVAHDYNLFDFKTLLPVGQPAFNTLAVPNEKVVAVHAARNMNP